MEAIRTKSTKFIERLTKSEFINTRLWGICIALCALCMVLVFAFTYVMVKPRPIYFIPGAWQAGVAIPSTNTTSTVSAFVTAWMLNWNNFNPTTANDVYKRAQQFMSPYMLSKAKSNLKKDLEEIERSSISSLFTLKEDPVIRSGKKGFEATIHGIKVLCMGKEIVKEQDLTFVVAIRVVGSTENNPYGLLIEDIDQEQKL